MREARVSGRATLPQPNPMRGFNEMFFKIINHTFTNTHVVCITYCDITQCPTYINLTKLCLYVTIFDKKVLPRVGITI